MATAEPILQTEHIASRSLTNPEDGQPQVIIDSRGRASFDTKRRVKPYVLPDELRYEIDPPRRVDRLLVDVEVRNCVNLQLPNGSSCPPGTSTIEIYRDQLQDVFDLVEPMPHEYEAACRVYERSLAILVIEGPEFGSEVIKSRTRGMKPDKVIELVMSGKDPEIEALVVRARKTSAISVESIFHSTWKRTPYPLISATVVGEKPVPEQHVDQQRSAMAAASAHPLIIAMTAQTETLIKAQQEQNAALMTALTSALAALASKAAK